MSDENEGGSSSDSDDSEDIVDILHGLPWQYHPLRAFLLEKMALNDFPADRSMFGINIVMRIALKEWSMMLHLDVVCWIYGRSSWWERAVLKMI